MSVDLFLRIMYLIWQLDQAYGFGVSQTLMNAATQYGAIVAASAAGNVSQISRRVLFEPFIGLDVARRFIKAAETASEQRSRAATLAVFLTNAIVIMLTMDPAANVAAGGLAVSEIGYMRSMIEKTRGGSIQLLDNPIKIRVVPPLLSPAQIKWNHDCKIIAENIFREHAARRYAHGSGTMLPNLYSVELPTLCPVGLTQLKAINQLKAITLKISPITLNIIPLIGRTSLVVGIIIVTGLCILSLWKGKKSKQYQNDEIVIDVSASIDD